MNPDTLVVKKAIIVPEIATFKHQKRKLTILVSIEFPFPIEIIDVKLSHQEFIKLFCSKIPIEY